MSGVLDYPIVVFVLSLLLVWVAVQIGGWIGHHRPLQESQRNDLSLLTNASLTLLALIIGFSFSMAVSRYDQRKNYEEEEANAIGTEYFRVGLIPAAEATRVRRLLSEYLQQRVLFYETHDSERLGEIDSKTAKLQTEMWTIVQDAAVAQPTPPMELVVSGMNDVLNRQGYTQAAWWNRIPAGAWTLMAALAVFCGLLIGYSVHRRGAVLLFTILPLVVSVAFFLIADIDSPRHGVIRVLPQNLISLSETMGK